LEMSKVEMAAATADPKGRWRSRCAQSVLACVGREKSACRKVLLLKLTLVFATTVRGNSIFFGDAIHPWGASSPGQIANSFSFGRGADASSGQNDLAPSRRKLARASRVSRAPSKPEASRSRTLSAGGVLIFSSTAIARRRRSVSP
jgi:hypothetical protein